MDQNPLETIETIVSAHDIGPIVFGPLHDESDHDSEQEADEYQLSSAAAYVSEEIRRMRTAGRYQMFFNI